MNIDPKRSRSRSTPRPSRKRPARATVHAPRQEDRQMRALESLLIHKREETIRDIEWHLGRQLSPELRENLTSALDAGDHSILDLADSIDFSLLEMKNRTLKDIEEAIRRVREKNYGLCEECGRSIPEGRLKAMPFARTCVHCQENRELLERIERKEDSV
jgi:DnaK suppressor protein